MTAKVKQVYEFEEALDMTGFGKFNFFALILCGSMIISMIFESLSVSYLVPASACELDTTSEQQGLIAGMPLMGIIATSHIWGFLADTKGRKKILQFSLVLGFVTGSLAAFSPHWMILSAFKLLSASAVSGTLALAFTLLGETTPSAKRNMLILLTSSINLTSTGVMAVLAIPILPLTFSYYIPYLNIHFNSWRLLNLIYAMPCALAAIGVYFAYESPKYLLSIGEEEQALAVLRGIYASNTGKDPEDFPVKSIVLKEEGNSKAVMGLWATIASQTIPLVKPPLLKNTVLISIMFALVYFCVNPYIMWLPFVTDKLMTSLERGQTDLTFCQMLRFSQEPVMSQNSTLVEEVKDCSLNQFAMIIVLVIGLMLSMLNLIISGFVNCFGRKRLLIGIQLVSGMAGLLVNVSTSWLLSAVFFMTFVANSLNFGVLTTFSVDVFPTYLKAMAVCLTLMVGRASSILGINILKNMLINNCELSFYIFAGLTVGGGLIGFLLPADAKIEKKKTIET